MVAAVPVTPPPASQTAAAHADSAAQQADKDHPHYRDGTYTGWGTSRHGDIQASVDIKDGRGYMNEQPPAMHPASPDYKGPPGGAGSGYR